MAYQPSPGDPGVLKALFKMLLDQSHRQHSQDWASPLLACSLPSQGSAEVSCHVCSWDGHLGLPWLVVPLRQDLACPSALDIAQGLAHSRCSAKLGWRDWSALHLLIPQIFHEHLVCSRHWPGCWGRSSEQNKATVFRDVTCSLGRGQAWTWICEFRVQGHRG